MQFPTFQPRPHESSPPEAEARESTFKNVGVISLEIQIILLRAKFATDFQTGTYKSYHRAPQISMEQLIDKPFVIGRCLWF